MILSIYNDLDPFGPFLDLLGPFRTFLGLFGPSFSLFGPLGPFWDLLNLFFTFMDFCEPFWPLWTFLGPLWTFWTLFFFLKIVFLDTICNFLIVCKEVRYKAQLQQNQWNLECEFSNHQKTLNNAQSVQKLSNMSQLKKSTEFCWAFFYVKKMRLF